MSAHRPRPFLRYLIATAVAVLLGTVALGAHLRQPSLPVLPGKGCIVTTFPNPNTPHVPPPYLELSACLHISETTLELDYHAAPDSGIGGLFEATGPEDPRQWPRFLDIRWLGADSIQIGYSHDVSFLSREDSVGAIRIIYVPLEGGGT